MSKQSLRKYLNTTIFLTKNIIQKYFLLFVVTITGACVLVIEILATRILAPYFGNTLYTVSSVITCILSALSIGYYFGGKIADKYKSKKLFYLIIFFSSLCVLIIQFLNIFLLPVFGFVFSLINGPLISSFLLFFIPSVLLGMLSPYTVQLYSSEKEPGNIGNITGTVFFWSTLGSIIGSLSAGFYFIPHFGIDTIIIGIGLILLFISITGLVLEKAFNKLGKVFLFTFVLIFFLINFLPKNSDILYQKDGLYERISIFDGKYQGKLTRFFMQDKSVSGAMFLNSDDLVFDYTKYYELYKLVNPNISSALVIGGGASFSIPKKLLQDSTQIHVDVAEIEPSLYALGKKYFNVPKTSRLHTITMDGRRYLHDTKNSYDLIYNDVFYSLDSVPMQFTTKEYFDLTKQHLQPNGIFIANVIGSLSPKSPSFFYSEMKTLHTVFPNSYAFAVRSNKSAALQNIILVGVKNESKRFFTSRVSGKETNQLLTQLPDHLIPINNVNFSPYILLTDNYSPVEYLTAMNLKNTYRIAPFFDDTDAFDLIAKQLQFGDRYTGSEGNKKLQDLISTAMKKYTDTLMIQSWQYKTIKGQIITGKNIIGRFNPAIEKRIILATHFDTKRFANNDSKHPTLSVPGADDGASGTAILLELAKSMSIDKPPIGIDLIFFDGEEGDPYATQKTWYPIGSRFFAGNSKILYSKSKPQEGIVIDMICDKHLNILEEPNSISSEKNNVEKLWNTGMAIDPTSFIKKNGPAILDDHATLQQMGIPSMLVIDFDYKYFHTTQDTLDKCSKKSLQVIGSTLLDYIYLGQ